MGILPTAAAAKSTGLAASFKPFSFSPSFPPIGLLGSRDLSAHRLGCAAWSASACRRRERGRNDRQSTGVLAWPFSEPDALHIGLHLVHDLCLQLGQSLARPQRVQDTAPSGLASCASELCWKDGRHRFRVRRTREEVPSLPWEVVLALRGVIATNGGICDPGGRKK